MPRLAASVSWMFNEVPLLERFRLAASCGFRAVEIQAPYDESADALAAAAREAGVEVILINTPAALASFPEREDEFQQCFAQALEYAKVLDCKQIHCLAGPAAGVFAKNAMIDNVQWAADAAVDAGIDIMLEPLNTVDHPDYFLTTVGRALEIMEIVQRPNVRLQFDCYHMQIMQGRLVDTIAEHLEAIGHIQISGVPARCEPDAQQEINYAYVLARLDELGYDGWVGCEYRPRATTLAGLDWARPYGIQAPRN